ncbi:hypothetical protein [Pisciglobus halotolerans]|uniref:Regulator of cell morphogenesis and NO signaling n=1 Tax=Pisciglobus halotolerans TaxID=745365 RepID=A0A1I3B3G0_9LACT|nr:hypothetical protein [Pisciglobus halotolerans]SFH56479.1 regulator of cell morphogenesis and NO signaling [Pisciglobus halotolerans]
MATFNEAAKQYFDDLDLFTNAITRVHGKNHPEAFEVRELFTTMNEKTEKAGAAKPELDHEFTRLRTITDHYTVPNDVCETYAAVYKMLSETDQAYYA